MIFIKKIFIDPGHGGDSVGASYKGRLEQDDCLRLSLAVRDILLSQEGVEVMLSRETDVDIDLIKRAEAANKWGADYFLSIHRNAFTPEGATGVEAYVYSKAETGGTTYQKAENIVSSVCLATGFRNRGVKKGAPSYTDFAVNRYTKMHSALLEVGFIDNTSDNALFDKCFSDIALEIARAILENEGVAYKAPEIRGDTDGDGKITAADARLVLRAAVGLEELTPEKADMNGDGKINAEDARIILRKSVGKEE